MELIVFKVSGFLRGIAVAGRTIVFDTNIAIGLLAINYSESQMEVGLLLVR